MTKVLNKISAFFGNQWTKLAFSLLAPGYTAFLGWVGWLALGYYLVPTNAAALFLLYLFINVMFMLLMIYTRRQLMTQIAAVLLHPCILVILVWGFGNWYMIIPPLITATVVFFAAKSSESLKVILGTIYLILFVLAVLGYLTLQMLTIRIPPGVDFNLRCPEEEYIYSEPKGTYRLVKYTDKETKENRVVLYYVENASEDLSLWFLECERVWGCQRVNASKITKLPKIKWLSENTLNIDGRVVDVTKLKVTAGEEEDDEEDGNNETSIITTR